MHRYLVYYKTEVKSFSSWTGDWTRSEYVSYDSTVVEGNSIGEVYDTFNSKSSIDLYGGLTGKFTQILNITDLGEIIKDEPVKPIKDKVEKTVDDWVNQLEG